MSELRRLIEADYQECVKLTPMPEDLRQSLRAHERAPAFLRNLEHELSKPKAAKRLNRETIKLTVYGLTDFFIKQVQRKASERMLSDLAKAAMKAEADRKAEVAKIVDEAEAKAEITGGPVIFDRLPE